MKSLLRKLFVGILILICHFVGYGQIQRGADIDGAVELSLGGFSVSMPNGCTVAMGEPKISGPASQGRIRVMDWNGTSWVQRGQSIEGSDFIGSNNFGGSVSMPNENTLAMGDGSFDPPNTFKSGAVLIFDWNGTSWEQRGELIEGEFTLDEFGGVVCMPNENTVAAGAKFSDLGGNSSGYVGIYDWDGTAWVQRGENIIGEGAGDLSGESIAMPDGNTVAIGAVGNSAGGNLSGHVRVFEWDGSAWVQKGADIDGLFNQRFGHAVSMPNANTLAFTMRRDNVDGVVLIYDWNGSAWVQRGAGIPGELTDDWNGYSTSMPNENLIAIGSIFNDGNGDNAGHVRIFEWNGSAWVQLGVDIDGEATGDFFGFDVHMVNSNTLAAGATRNDGAGLNAGHVRVFDLNSSDISTSVCNVTVCSGESVNLNDYVQGNNITYHTSLTGAMMAGGSTDVANNPVSYTESTTIYVRDTTNSGNSVVDNITITVTTVISDPFNSGPYCEGETLELSAGDGSSYLWSGPNGFSSTDQNPVIPNAGVSEGGDYTLTMTSGGCSATETTTVVINPFPNVSVDNTGPYCGDVTVELNADGGESYSWTGPNGFSSMEQNPIIENAGMLGAGEYTVTVGLSGCTTMETTTVVVNEAQASNTGSYCSGESIVLNVTGGESYSWTGPNGYTSTDQNPIISNGGVINAGTYTVAVTFDGCVDVTTTEVELNPTPDVELMNTGPYCAGDSIILNASSGGDLYSWSGPNGYTSIDQNPIIEDAGTVNGGVYILTVRLGECEDSGTTTVMVSESVMAEASNTGSYCLGDSIMLTSSGGESYMWTGPNGFSSEEQNPVIPNSVVENGGEYMVRVFSGEACPDSVQTVVVVNEEANAEISGNTGLCNSQSSSLSVEVCVGCEYSWFPNGETSSSIEVSEAGMYSVTVTTSEGCISMGQQEVTISDSLDPNLSYTDECEGGVIRIDAASGFTYMWSTGETTQSIDVEEGGTYGVTISNGFCVGMEEIEVSFNPIPVLEVEKDPEICLGEATTISAKGFFGTEPYTYVWSNGLSNVDSHEVSPAVTTTYSVYLRDQVGCMTEADSITVLVNDLPLISAGEDQEGCAGVEYMLCAEGSENLIYTWIVEDSMMTRCIAVSPEETTEYIVRGMEELTGCATVDTVRVMSYGGIEIEYDDLKDSVTASGGTGPIMLTTVREGSTIEVMATDSVGCMAERTFIIDAVYAPELNAEIEIYPNPAKDELNIRYGEVKNDMERLEVFDMLGRKVRAYEGGNLPQQIGLEGMSSSQYMLRFCLEDDRCIMKRAIILRN